MTWIKVQHRFYVGQNAGEVAGEIQAAHQNVRHIVVDVLIRIPHVAAVEHQGMIQQCSIAVGSLGHPLDQMGQHLNVILVDLR